MADNEGGDGQRLGAERACSRPRLFFLAYQRRAIREWNLSQVISRKLGFCSAKRSVLAGVNFSPSFCPPPHSFSLCFFFLLLHSPPTFFALCCRVPRSLLRPSLASLFAPLPRTPVDHHTDSISMPDISRDRSTQ